MIRPQTGSRASTRARYTHPRYDNAPRAYAPSSAAASQPDSTRAQRAVLGLFRAYVAFVLAGLAFLALTDSHALAPAFSHPLLSLCWLIVAVGALGALAAVLLGGLPLALAALIRAALTRRHDLWLLAVPIPAFLAYFLTNGFGFIGGGPLPLPGAIRLAVGLLAAVVSVSALTHFVARNLRGRALYRFALVPSVGLVLSMALALLGLLGWGVLAALGQPRVFAGQSALLGLPVWLAWLALLLTMFAATGVGAVRVVRGIFSRALLRDLRAAWAFLVALLATARAVLGDVARAMRPTTAIERLRERYARGEIGIETFAERVRSLLAMEA